MRRSTGDTYVETVTGTRNLPRTSRPARGATSWSFENPRREVGPDCAVREGLGKTAPSQSQVEHPLFSEPVSYTVDVVGDQPDEQVAYTVGLMKRYVREDARAPEVKRAAEVLARGTRTDREKVDRVWAWVKGRLTFMNDPEQAEPLGLAGNGNEVIETLVRPVDVLRAGSHGDCDDFSMLCACLLKALGIKASFATVGADERDPAQFSHVYVVAYTKDGERVAVDASHGPYAGWEAPNKYGKFREWPVDGEVEPEGLVAMGLVLGALWMWSQGEGGSA